MNTIEGSRLTTVLAVLSPSEWRVFKRFIVSGVAGPVGKSVELYGYFLKAYPAFKGPQMSKEAIYNAIFPLQIYDDKKLRYALTDLYRQACSFLKFKALEQHGGEGDYLLATTLASRNADKAYLALYHSDEQPRYMDAGNSAELFFHNYRKQFVHLNYYLSRQKRNEQNPIGSVARNLDLFFIVKKLQLLCEIINVRNVMSVQYDFLLQDKIMELVSQGIFDDIPAITIYYRVMMTLTHPDDEEHFVILQKSLLDHEQNFGKDELRDMYQYLMNYCIKKINVGTVKYVTTLFDVYKTILANKVIYAGPFLSQWDFKNMVVIGIRAGAFEWVKEFIETYCKDLAENERQNAYDYNLAYYYFSQGEFKKTLNLLQQVEFTDLYYQLDMRAILLKCYFEMDDQEAFFYHVAAFRIFISRNKLISDYQRTIYRNMIKYSTRLLRAEGDAEKSGLILNEINEVKQIADLNWLRKKAESVIN